MSLLREILEKSARPSHRRHSASCQLGLALQPRRPAAYFVATSSPRLRGPRRLVPVPGLAARTGDWRRTVVEGHDRQGRCQGVIGPWGGLFGGRPFFVLNAYAVQYAHPPPMETCPRCGREFVANPADQCGVCDGPLCPDCWDCPRQCWVSGKRAQIRGSVVHHLAASASRNRETDDRGGPTGPPLCF